jgi:hypothetical protein
MFSSCSSDRSFVDTSASNAIVSPLHTYAPAEATPELFSLQRLLEVQPAEPEWVVPGLLPIGVSVLAGPPQIDKPLLASQLGLSVASGQPFLDLFPVRQGPVLYLALAEHFRHIQGRALRLLGSQKLPEEFTYALKWSPFRASGLADLEDTLMSLGKARLIIVDPLEFLVTPPAPHARTRQGNASAREPGFFLPLRELAARYQVAILLLHHLPEDWPSSRADLLAGPGPLGLTPASACNLLLIPEGRPGRGSLHIAGAQVEEQRLSLANAGQWYLTGQEPGM